MNTLKPRLTMAFAPALIAGGVLAGLVATHDSAGTTDAGRRTDASTDAPVPAEPIVYAGSYGLYPAK